MEFHNRAMPQLEEAMNKECRMALEAGKDKAYILLWDLYKEHSLTTP
jgi:hypothetical protein